MRWRRVERWLVWLALYLGLSFLGLVAGDALRGVLPWGTVERGDRGFE